MRRHSTPGGGDPYQMRLQLVTDPYRQPETPPPPPPCFFQDLPPPPPPQFLAPASPFIVERPTPPPLTNYVILRDASAMSIMPATEEVKKFLTLRYREMEKVGRRTIFHQRAEPMYRILTRDGQEVAQTYQGLWKDLETYLRKKKRSVTTVDLTLPFGLPNMEAAMRGLTLSQQALLRHALEQDMSGLIGAPTRYGKTYLIAGFCRAYNGKKIVITAPGIDLCQQIERDLMEIMPDRDIRGIYTGSKHRTQGPDITVCSVDSLARCDTGSTDLILIDEPHAMVADGRLPKINQFYRARKIGFGATLDGRFDKKDRLITALIGPILANKTYLEAVAEGSIAPLKVVFIKVPFSKDTVPGRCDRETTWKRLLTQSAKVASIIKTICSECVPHDWQTMVFIKDEKQADYLFVESMDPTCSVAMAKKLKPKPRKALTKRIASNEVTRVIASNIYVQGVTFPDLRLVVNAASGGATTSAIQKPGRLLQRRPNKNYGVMVDLLFECTDADDDHRDNPPYHALIGECWARHRAYTKIGYDITIARGVGHLKEIIQGSYAAN